MHEGRERTVPNNKTERPLAHYRARFAQADPHTLAAKTGLTFNADTSCFAIRVMDVHVLLHWPDGVAMRATDAPDAVEASGPLTILLLHMLLDGTLVPSTGAFIPYAQIPWGTEYQDAFTGRCLKRLAYSFSCAHAFALACEHVGGSALADKARADEAYEIEFVPGVVIRAYFWEGDDEFEPRAQVLFSDNIPLAFTAEDVAVIGDLFITALKTGGVK